MKEEMGIREKMYRFFTVRSYWDKKEKAQYMKIYRLRVNPEEITYKINADFLKLNALQDCYREIMVSFLPMLPLVEKTVPLKEADYILYAHPYARCDDASEVAVKQLKAIAESRKENAEIIVVGKAANAEKLLNGSIPNITFWHDHYTEKLGKKFGFAIQDQFIVYDDYYYDRDVRFPDKKGQLNIWPVNGCNRKCNFCRRSYMYIPFEYLELEVIKEKLDWYQQNYPERMEYVSLRAENLTEYPYLAELIDLLDSYREIKRIEMRIGMAIGEITEKVLKAICRCGKIVEIGLNPEAGTDRLLNLIGKGHTRARALSIFQQIREAHPDIRIEGTIMIGLPTETIEDIYQLADFLGQAKLDFILCNYYIMAPGHPLAKLPQMSTSLKEYHLKILKKQLKQKVQRECVFHSHKIVRRDSREYVRLQEKNKHLDLPEHFYEQRKYIPRK